ncbi:hypothetical protein D5086_013970 [Populus alba]|uniref:Uncharacterized protein n=1 Tax=Populus alba TaxID=43335 RepID=A0ACC4C804_POPAL
MASPETLAPLILAIFCSIVSSCESSFPSLLFPSYSPPTPVPSSYPAYPPPENEPVSPSPSPAYFPPEPVTPSYPAVPVTPSCPPQAALPMKPAPSTAYYLPIPAAPSYSVPSPSAVPAYPGVPASSPPLPAPAASPVSYPPVPASPEPYRIIKELKEHIGLRLMDLKPPPLTLHISPTFSMRMINLALLVKEGHEALVHEASASGKPRLLLTAASNVSTSFGIGSWIQAGVSPKKLATGLPLYGRMWKLLDPDVNGIGARAVGEGPGGRYWIIIRSSLQGLEAWVDTFSGLWARIRIGLSQN